MTSAITLKELISVLTELSLEDQRTLNTALVQSIKRGIKVIAATKAIAFNIGDILEFDAKTRGRIFIEVTGFSRDISKVKGRQVNTGWSTKVGTNWTVGASALKVSTLEKAMAA